MNIYYSNDFKIGLKILFEKKPFCIESVEFVKPGKGRAFSRVKLRNLLNNQLIEKTFRTTDYLFRADVIDVKLTYIYYDSQDWYFMDPVYFNQFVLNTFIMGEKYKWIIEGNNYLITLWNNIPISITLDNFVVFKVICILSEKELDNDLFIDDKYNFCKLHTGTILKVPVFIKVGDMIKVDTRTGEYNARLKK